MAQKCTIDQIKVALSNLQSELDHIDQSKKDIADDLQPESETQPKKANDVDSNEEPVEKPVEEKKQSSSLWDRIRGAVKKGFKVKKETSTYASDSAEGSQGGSRKGKGNTRQDQEDANLEILKLQNDIRQMKAAFEKLTHFQSSINKSLETEVPTNKLKAILSKTDSVKSRARDIKEIRRKVLNLKGQIPSLLKNQSSIGLSITDSQTAEDNGQIVETGSDINLPGLHDSYDFKHSSAFEEVVEKFEALVEFTDKLCLLSLAVFPENKEVERTMLMYWWIGEGFISYQDSEETVTKILDEFSRIGLIEAVEDEKKLKPSGYKMEPHVHAAVIDLASRMGLFKLYSGKKLKMQKSDRNNVCLVKRSSLQPEAKASEMIVKDLNSVFNSSERYPDFTFKWFPEMESLKVLYLGRWERTAKRHIEVESTKFLKDMKSLKNLRLASFQGISRIENLKELTCSLPKLVILDLRACYNLEGLPTDIGSLESLIYLDVSECYMLDRMPREISRLKELQVLKGFVISQSDNEKECAVKHLKKLRKLSITVNRYQFMVEDFMESLKDLQELNSLKIAWGARFPDKDGAKEHGDPKEGEDGQVHKMGQTSEEKNKDGNTKANPKEEKKRHEEAADKVVEGDKGNAESLRSEKKASPSRWETENKPDDEEGKSKVAGEGDKGKVVTEEEKKKEVSSKQESAKKKQEENGDGEKDNKVNPEEEGKKKDEVKEVSSKPDKVTEGDNKTQESKDTVKSKPDDPQTEGEKKDEVKAENSEPDKKTSLSQDTVTSKPDDKQEGKKDEGGKKKEEVEAMSSKPAKEDKKTSPRQESKDTIQSKPDDDQRGEIQEEKIDKIQGVQKKDELKAEPEKVDNQTNEAQQSKDTKPDKENSKVQETRDGEKLKAALKKPGEGEAKTHKLDKKVSFSEEPKAPIQKKSATKESGLRIPRLFTRTKTETKRGRDDSGTNTSKLPSSLTKLELECYPDKEPPVWLNPKTLDKLQKLSIKGGNLSRFSEEPPNAKNKCGVQILRLKYLHEFKAEWKDLHALFPQLKLLEKYKCPQVAFCPTDGNGVWRSQP